MAFLAVSLTAVSQNTNSGYFVEEYTYRYQLNPAFGNENEYVAMPGIGNINFAIKGNLHLTDVLYNKNGKTMTFLNPGVSTSEFMNNIADNNTLGLDTKIGILSAGFKAFGGYNTISINVRANEQTSIPKELFSLAKEGVTNAVYDISDFNVHADGYAELVLGHSRNINKHLRLGAAVKLLVGAANLDADFTDANITLGEDMWTAVVDAQIRTNMKGAHYTHTNNDRTGHEYVDGIEIDGAGIGGFGAAVDLGAVYMLNEDWQFSAAVLDLGFISWNNDVVASTNGTQTFTTADYTFNVDEDAPNGFEKEFDRLKDDVSALYELNDLGDMGSRTRMLSATLNLAAQYTFPLYRKLTFGLLNSTKFQGRFTQTDFRFSANVAPAKIFSAGVNFAAGTYGCGFGWLLNFHPKGFNLFLGMDHTFAKLAKQGVPLSSNASFNLGMNFPF